MQEFEFERRAPRQIANNVTKRVLSRPAALLPPTTTTASPPAHNMQRSSPFAAGNRQVSATSTPITALPSSLGSRTASTLPPASTTYEPLAKAVLAQRFLRQVLAVSIGAVLVVSVLWTSWDAGGITSIGLLSFVKNCVSPSSITLTFVWGVFAVLPIAVLRKRHVQGERSIFFMSLRILNGLIATGPLSLSPSQTLATNLKDARYIEEIAVLLISSLSTTVLHAWMADFLSGGGAGLAIFAGSKYVVNERVRSRDDLRSTHRKHPLHLNGRLIFLLFSQSVAAALYWTRDLLRSRFLTRWSKEENVRSLNTIAFKLA